MRKNGSNNISSWGGCTILLCGCLFWLWSSESIRCRYLQYICHLVALFHLQMGRISSFPGDTFIDPSNKSHPQTLIQKQCFMIGMYNKHETRPPNQSGALSVNKGAPLRKLLYTRRILLIKVTHQAGDPFCWFTLATLAKNSCLISHLEALLTSSTVNKPLQWVMHPLLLCINSVLSVEPNGSKFKWGLLLFVFFYGTDLLLSPLLCVLTHVPSVSPWVAAWHFHTHSQSRRWAGLFPGVTC